MKNKTDRIQLRPDEKVIIERAISKLLSNVEIPKRDDIRLANREARKLLLPVIITKRELDAVNKKIAVYKSKKDSVKVKALTDTKLLLTNALRKEQIIANGELTLLRHRIDDQVKGRLKPEDMIAKTKEEARKRRSRGIAWFEDKIKRYVKNDTDHTWSNYQPKQVPFIGGMFFYIYDAKHKDKLPYWDALPLVIPFSIQDDRMTCINLHYLPIDLRIVLLKKLMEFSTKYKGREYMKISYNMLKSLSEIKLVKPTIHTYLYSHIKTRLIKVNADAWGVAAYLPVTEFQKATNRKVWSDSRRKAQ